MSQQLAGELVIRCFHSRTAAHIFHLGTKSYAKHKALQEFYESIIDLADTFAESYQGLHGLLKLSDTAYKQSTTPEAMLDDLLVWIANNRADVCPKSETALQNLIDEIVALIAQTMYKLANLS